jgi:hypothetical protein
MLLALLAVLLEEVALVEEEILGAEALLEIVKA